MATISLTQNNERPLINSSVTLSINSDRTEAHHISLQALPETIGNELIHELKNVIPAAIAHAQATTSAKRNKVKRPMNSFLVFASHMRPILQAENKDLNNAQISKLLGTKWQMMSEVDRASYVEAATKIRAEFTAAHPDYVYTKTPRKHKKRKLATEAEMLKAEAEEADIRKRLAASSTSSLHPVRVPSPQPQPQSQHHEALSELDPAFLQALAEQHVAQQDVAQQEAQAQQQLLQLQMDQLQQQEEQPQALAQPAVVAPTPAVPHVELVSSLDMLPDHFLLLTAPPPPLEITSFFETAFL